MESDLVLGFLVEEHVSSLHGFINYLGKPGIVLFGGGTPFIFTKKRKQKSNLVTFGKAKLELPGSNMHILSIELSSKLEEDSCIPL